MVENLDQDCVSSFSQEFAPSSNLAAGEAGERLTTTEGQKATPRKPRHQSCFVAAYSS